MELIHPVIDTDAQFEIDSVSRSVKNVSETKTMLMQYDHNSERFTFKIPRFIDGHDMSLCNLVRAHYINIEKAHRTQNSGICEITDLAICPEDDQYVTCSWLVSRNATQLAGSLHFVVQFACEKDGNLLYSWNTAKHTSVTVAEGLFCGENIPEEYNDLLVAWKNQLEANQISNIEQTTVSTEDNGENVWTVTFGDGRTKELKVRNGSRGDTSLVGSIETVQGNPLHFFVGTKAEYEALPDDAKVNLFALFTDETSTDGILTALEKIKKSQQRFIIEVGDNGQRLQHGIGEINFGNIFAMDGRYANDTLGVGVGAKLSFNDGSEEVSLSTLWCSTSFTYKGQSSVLVLHNSKLYSLNVTLELTDSNVLKFYSAICDLQTSTVMSDCDLIVNVVNFYCKLGGI